MQPSAEYTIPIQMVLQPRSVAGEDVYSNSVNLHELLYHLYHLERHGRRDPSKQASIKTP